MGNVLILIIAILIFIIWPFAAIWAVNTLFGLNIAMNFVNWCAAFILLLIFQSHRHVKIEK